MEESLAVRLRALADRGGAAARALWIETLPPREALTELFGLEDDLSLLQKARFLLEMGRGEDAREVLDQVAGERPGLRQVRDELLGALAGLEPVDADRVGEGEPTLLSATLAALHAQQGDVDAAAEIYRAILARDPTDLEAREGLAALAGQGGGEAPVQALGGWLSRVRRWREHLGV